MTRRSRRSDRPQPPHTDAAHAAITAELVRLSLPHHPSTGRVELVTDGPGAGLRAKLNRIRLYTMEHQ